MSDRFFTVAKCDRCGASLEGGRIMSMFTEDCIVWTVIKRNGNCLSSNTQSMRKLLKYGAETITLTV